MNRVLCKTRGDGQMLEIEEFAFNEYVRSYGEANHMVMPLDKYGKAIVWCDFCKEKIKDKKVETDPEVNIYLVRKRPVCGKCFGRWFEIEKGDGISV